jgi:hypothetical protein
VKNLVRILALAALAGLLALPTAAQAQVPDPPPRPLPEVVGGDDADPGEDPWMAALVIHERFIDNPFAGLICGGSMISPDTMLTAAHCVVFDSPSNLEVVVGSQDLLPETTERIGVRNIRVHPEIDAAVVQLVRPVPGHVTPLDLVAPGEEALWEPGDAARFTGWGVDEAGEPVSHLQEAEAPIVADTDCKARYGRIFRGRQMLCVGDIGPGGGSVSPCFGDSGGPLTVLDGSRPILVGMVLGGFACGDPNYPAVFTQVSAVRTFVEPYLDPDGVPGAVRDLRARRAGPERRAAVVTWRPPLFDGGAPIRQHFVTVQPGNRQFAVGGRADHLRIPHLPPNTPVRITITPNNVVGDGPTSAVVV